MIENAVVQPVEIFPGFAPDDLGELFDVAPGNKDNQPAAIIIFERKGVLVIGESDVIHRIGSVVRIFSLSVDRYVVVRDTGLQGVENVKAVRPLQPDLLEYPDTGTFAPPVEIRLADYFR